MKVFTDTIAAISTPPGKGGVALIRMSGDDAFDIADRVFAPKYKKTGELLPRTQYYGFITDGADTVDDVLITRFPSPGSYTGENTVEISCHGGVFVTRAVLTTLLKNGARAAEAGEFTRRAFLNGRLSLTEAEAISSLLEASSDSQLKLASEPSRRVLAEKIAALRSELVGVMSSVYARIDYPDEDLGDLDDGDVIKMLASAENAIGGLLRTYRTGRSITEGVSCAICGKPNVGKSSFYNALIGEDSAIVTDIAGTTRDVLEHSVALGGVMLRLSDTAGIRDIQNADTVERIGIQKSRNVMENCNLLFAIFDNSRPFDEEDEEMLQLIDGLKIPKIAIINKADLPRKLDPLRLDGRFHRVIHISAKDITPEQIDMLTQTVADLFTDDRIEVGKDAIISSARQHAELSRALEFVSLARRGLEAGFAQDAVSTDIERAIGAISRLDGREVGEEIVADIFSKFCVGK